MKRFAILLCLSSLAVFFSRPLFYSKEVSFSFDAKVGEKSELMVFASGSDIRKSDTTRELEPDTAFRTLNFILPVSRLFGVKILVPENAGTFEVCNMRFKGEQEFSLPSESVKILPEHVDNFVSKQSCFSGKAGKGAVVTLLMNDLMEGKGYFTFPVFFTVFVLWFLVFDKLGEPLWNLLLKTYRSCPDKTDGAFLVVLLFLMVLPALNIDFESVISRENRKLAPMAHLFADGRINNAFGRQFDEWFKDRFTGRDGIINLYNMFQNSVNRKFERHGVILGKDNWMFHGRTANFQGTDIFPQSDLEKMRDNLRRLQHFCDALGIKLYIIVSPYKHHVYPEFYPKNVKRSDKVKRMDLISSYFAAELPDVNFLYLKDTLLDAKKRTKEWLYFKTDHHWTDRGAFEAYKEVMKRISKDFPSVRPVGLENYRRTTGRKVRAECDRNFSTGRQYTSLNFNDESVFNLDYAFYDHKHPENLKIDDQCNPKSFARNDKAAPYKVFYITDSQGENFIGFLGHTFRDIQKRRYNAEIKPKRKNENIYMSFYENDIKAYRPDILILQTYDAYMPSFTALYED